MIGFLMKSPINHSKTYTYLHLACEQGLASMNIHPAGFGLWTFKIRSCSVALPGLVQSSFSIRNDGDQALLCTYRPMRILTVWSSYGRRAWPTAATHGKAWKAQETGNLLVE